MFVSLGLIMGQEARIIGTGIGTTGLIATGVGIDVVFRTLIFILFIKYYMIIFIFI
jgi:hypothetical protein